MKKWYLLLLLPFVAITLWAYGGNQPFWWDEPQDYWDQPGQYWDVPPSAFLTPTPSRTFTITQTPSRTPTLFPTQPPGSVTWTAALTSTPTATPTATPTDTPVGTATPGPNDCCQTIASTACAAPISGACGAGTLLVYDASCVSGLCVLHTPTEAPEAPTDTPEPTATSTPRPVNIFAIPEAGNSINSPIFEFTRESLDGAPFGCNFTRQMFTGEQIDGLQLFTEVKETTHNSHCPTTIIAHVWASEQTFVLQPISTNPVSGLMCKYSIRLLPVTTSGRTLVCKIRMNVEKEDF